MLPPQVGRAADPHRPYPCEKANSVNTVPGGVTLNTLKLKMKKRKSLALRGQGVAKPAKGVSLGAMPKNATPYPIDDTERNTRGSPPIGNLVHLAIDV